jgi:hypothetical protein
MMVPLLSFALLDAKKEVVILGILPGENTEIGLFLQQPRTRKQTLISALV